MLSYIYDNIISGGIILEKSHTSKRKQVQITPDNSIDKGAVPVGVPCTYLALERIQATEREGYFVMFVVNKEVHPCSEYQKEHIDIKPIRNSIGEYLVIICRTK